MDVPPFRPVPGQYLYQVLAGHLAARIAAGDLPRGSRLRSERDLAAEYGVAYHTVRGAIRVLREQGLVVTLHGSGNWIAETQEAPPSGDGGA